MKTKANRSLRNGVQVAVVVVGFMTLLSGARQAWAGSWVPFGGDGAAPYHNNSGYTLVGISNGGSGGVNSPKAMTPWSQEDGWDTWGYGGQASLDLSNWVYDGDNVTPGPVGGNVSTQGNVSRTFKWIPSSGKDLNSDPPPNSLRVRVHSEVIAGAASTTSAVSLTPIINNGFVGYAGNTVTSYMSFGFETRTMAGTFLLSIDNSTRQQLVTSPPYSLSGLATFNAIGSGDVWVSAQMTIDLAS